MNKNKSESKEIAHKIKTWSFEDLPPFPVYFFVAKRMEGKSVLIKDIVYNTKEKYDDVYLFSRTANQNTDDPYPFIKNKDHRFDDYDDDFLTELMASQKKDLMAFKNKEIPKVKTILLIFDDVLMNKDIKKHNSALEELCVNGRHYYFVVVITAQIFSSGMLPSIRKNTDVFASFNIMDFGTRKLVTEYYLSIIDRKTGESMLHDIITEKPYQCLIAKTYIKGIRKYEDFVFKYTAQLDIPDFTIPMSDHKTAVINNDENPFNDMRLTDTDDFYV